MKRNCSYLTPLLLTASFAAGADVAPHVALTGIERTMLALHRATEEPAYLDFVRARVIHVTRKLWKSRTR